ncbi:MAG: septum formation initiator family protein [Ignavibacteriaceae bacterium]|jgi:cell division protein FtsL
MSKLKYIVFSLFFLGGFLYLLFNESGVIKFLKLKQQVKSLNEQISDVDKDNKRLQAEIDSLKNKVPAKIERIAREKYGMIRKGEKTIKVNEK